MMHKVVIKKEYEKVVPRYIQPAGDGVYLKILDYYNGNDISFMFDITCDD
jgi:hypothetical protein